MTDTVFLVMLPLAFILALLGLLLRRMWRAIVLALVMALGTIATAIWVIESSLDSSKWGEYFTLPSFASLVGLLAIASVDLRSARRRWLRGLGYGALLTAVSLPVVHAAYSSRKNHEIVRARFEAEAPYRAVVALRSRIASMPQQALHDTIQDLIINGTISSDDRAVALQALDRKDLPPSLLDTLAALADPDIAPKAVRHPNTASETIARVYRNSFDPRFFYDAIASHAHTPPAILRELYSMSPRPVERLDESFAENPAMPRELLDKLARTDDVSTAVNLLHNPAIDCTLARTVGAGPAAAPSKWNSQLVRDAAATAERTLCG